MDGSHSNNPAGITTGKVSQDKEGFAKVKVLLDAMGGLTLSQVCSITGLEATTIQNWVKRGWVSNPNGKKYEEKHIARILIVNALKECFKLEHITLLMGYVNNCREGQSETNIKESELYDCLCKALQMLGQVDDFSRSGVESIVDKAMSSYNPATIDARMRIRKALTVMIYACVCTDVKRGTEAMMKQILEEFENPASILNVLKPYETDYSRNEEAEEPLISKIEIEELPPFEEPVPEVRKTISQTIREWEEISNAQRKPADELAAVSGDSADSTDKMTSRSFLERLGIK